MRPPAGPAAAAIPPTRLRRDVALAPRTTFGSGGPARRFDLGGATAEDVRVLVDEVQLRVARRLGRTVEPEIAFPGSC